MSDVRVRNRLLVWVAAAAVSLAGAGAAVADDVEMPRSASPQGAQVYLISPADGDTLSNPVLVRFGLQGMGVAPAGVEKDGTGHHHLIIDAEAPRMGLPIPSDEHHRHFGGGQTEVTLDLRPGQHTLQLLLADHNHIPHQPPVSSKRITITVR